MVMFCGQGSPLFAHENPNSKKRLDEIFVDLNLNRSTLEETLLAIEEQTAFRFVYNEKTLKNIKK